MFELTAKTTAGARLVQIAESLAEDFARHATADDRGTWLPHAAIEVLRSSRYLAAPAPVENGGLGVTAVHDIVVASSRLARGDTRIATAVNAHLAPLLSLVRRWRAAADAGDRSRAHALAASMNAIVRDGAGMTNAPDEFGETCLAGLFDASVSLGAAERAWSDTTAARPRASDALVAEIRIDLGACRATLSRAAALVDEWHGDPVALSAETEAATAFVDAAAGRIVNRANAISDGNGAPGERHEALATGLAGLAAHGITVRRVIGDPSTGAYAAMVRAELGARSTPMKPYLLWSATGQGYTLHCSDPCVAELVATSCDTGGVTMRCGRSGSSDPVL